ncbi:hypothetical protein V6N13_149534 [Hibiscus sabdariffa]
MAVFVKVLTKIDVERTLSIPDGCVQALPEFQCIHGKELRVMDDVGNLWNFRCIIRVGVVPKLTIGSGTLIHLQGQITKSKFSGMIKGEKERLTIAYLIDLKKEHRKESTFEIISCLKLPLRIRYLNEQLSTLSLRQDQASI